MKDAERIELLKSFDDEYASSISFLAGCDEAGRGPLAGPVVAACVILPRESRISYVNDSKKVSKLRRGKVYDDIMAEAISVGVGIIGPKEIDEINILQATYKAMQEAVNSLSQTPELLLNDAIIIPDIDIPQEKIVKGDAKSYSIAAASIIAKVTRDRMMEEYDKEYPGYGFSNHKGYGTKAHYEALRNLGMCDIHRRSFLKKMH